jgi:hypothetical protein
MREVRGKIYEIEFCPNGAIMSDGSLALVSANPRSPPLAQINLLQGLALFCRRKFLFELEILQNYNQALLRRSWSIVS